MKLNYNKDVWHNAGCLINSIRENHCSGEYFSETRNVNISKFMGFITSGNHSASVIVNGKSSHVTFFKCGEGMYAMVYTKRGKSNKGYVSSVRTVKAIVEFDNATEGNSEYRKINASMKKGQYGEYYFWDCPVISEG